MITTALAILRKDLTLELRTRESVPAMALLRFWMLATPRVARGFKDRLVVTLAETRGTM